MSLYYNRTEIIGCLGQDVEVKQSKAGKDYASFSVATKRYMGKDKESETMWHNVTVFGQNATYLTGRARKGMWIFVIGEYVKETYTKDEQERVSFKLLASDVKLIGNIVKSDSTERTAAPKAAAVPAGNVPDDDEIPF